MKDAYVDTGTAQHAQSNRKLTIELFRQLKGILSKVKMRGLFREIIMMKIMQLEMSFPGN